MFWQCEWVCHLQLVHAPANVSAAPAQATPSKVAQPTGASTAADDGGIDSDLQARLDNLRKMWGDFQICGGSVVTSSYFINGTPPSMDGTYCG